MKVNRIPAALSFSAADYPALRSFLRGYLHEDMKDEYGSPEEAAREFCSDSSGEEHAAVANEWSRFLAQTHGQSIEAINKILTGPLGSAQVLSQEDISRLSAALSPSARRSKKA